MERFSKKDLKLLYRWDYELDPYLIMQKEPTFFRRKQGWDVLYMANSVLECMGHTSKQALHKYEDMIANKLPKHVRGRIKVREWVIKNWK
jgi:hypothetical protein